MQRKPLDPAEHFDGLRVRKYCELLDWLHLLHLRTYLMNLIETNASFWNLVSMSLYTVFMWNPLPNFKRKMPDFLLEDVAINV